MGILKPVKGKNIVSITIKMPVELHNQINRVKDGLKAQGYTVDLSEAATQGIRRMINAAERELEALVGRPSKEKADSVNKPPAVPSGKTPTKSASPTPASAT